MKITELSDRELRRALQATERAAGPGSAFVTAARKELSRRRKKRQAAKARRQEANHDAAALASNTRTSPAGGQRPATKGTTCD